MIKTRLKALAGAAMATALVVSSAPAPADQFIPSLIYRTGPYAPGGVPFADGVADYITLLNERDGGIGGVRLELEECETGYNTDRGVECYERLNNKGTKREAAAFSPLSTGITYAIIERATADKIPVFSMGYGRTSASDGRVFPYVFTMPATYWSQASSIIRYIGGVEGGMSRLAGKKIALIYHDSAYGKEPIPTLEILAARFGYDFSKFPVPHPGLEQKSTWLRVGRQLRPDYVILWGWGIMNSTALKEAAAVGFPVKKIIGNWWSGSEQDVQPAAGAAIGYKSATFHAPSTTTKMHEDLRRYVLNPGKGAGKGDSVGTVLYNRGIINSMFVTEAIRNAQGRFGKRVLKGEEVRWGFENINIDAKRMKELGIEGLLYPVKVSCADHEGASPVRIQQWDGQVWRFVSPWLKPMTEIVRPLIEEDAAKYAQEKGITPRVCS